MTIKKVFGIIFIVMGILISFSGLGVIFYMVDYYYRYGELTVGLLFVGPSALFFGTIFLIIGLFLLVCNMIKNRKTSTQ
jgi:hypothetical protein